MYTTIGIYKCNRSDCYYNINGECTSCDDLYDLNSDDCVSYEGGI